jgi:hypothetical protein
MAKGICELDVGSRGACETCVKELSGKKALLVAPGGCVDVGDGKTSVSLCGISFRSLFQMAVPQGNAADPETRPRTADEAE